MFCVTGVCDVIGMVMVYAFQIAQILILNITYNRFKNLFQNHFNFMIFSKTCKINRPNKLHNPGII